MAETTQDTALWGSRLVLVFERCVFSGQKGHKIGRRERGDVAEAFQRLKAIWHPNLCCYTDMLRTDEGEYILVSEGYSLTLDDVVAKSKRGNYAVSTGKTADGLDLEEVAHQVICGLQYLHANGIGHGALGLHNIFIHSDGTVKLGCYGHDYLRECAAGANGTSKRHRRPCGTQSAPAGGDVRREPAWRGDRLTSPLELMKMWYQPPDLMGDTNCWRTWEARAKGDVWALGICLLQIIAAIVEKSSPEFDVTAAPGNSVSGEPMRMYESVVQLSKCADARAVVAEAFPLAASIIDIATRELQDGPPISMFGLDIVGMCEDALASSCDTGGNALTEMERLAELIDRVSLRGDDLADELGSVVPNGLTNGLSDGYHHAFQTYHATVGGPQSGQSGARVNDSGHDCDLAKAINHAAGQIINWCTGKPLVNDLLRFVGVDIAKGIDDTGREAQPEVERVYRLFRIAHQCLIVNPDQRPAAMDILGMIRKEARQQDTQREGDDDGANVFAWAVLPRTGTGATRGQRDLMTEEDFINRYYRMRDVRDKDLDRLALSIDDIFYFWRLIGNDTLDALVECDYLVQETDAVKGAGQWDATAALLGQEHYYEANSLSYMRQLVPLDELMKCCKTADLFPMVIEHQIRPTCAYARTFTFLYQWIRIRRFEKLMQNGMESKSQVILEAQLDVPPFLRKEIWYLVMGIKAPLKCPAMNRFESEEGCGDRAEQRMGSEEEGSDDVIGRVPVELENVIKRYDNDLLYSNRCVRLMAKAGAEVQSTYALESVPAAVYEVCVPLVILYYAFEDVFIAAVKHVFDKYLKRYYVPSDAFVQNDLAQFNTMLNFFDPEVAAHMRDIGAFADSFVLLWFMSLFAEAASLQQVYVLWDAMLIFPRKYLKYVAVAILQNVREGILQATTAAMAISYLSNLMDAVNAPMLNAICDHMYKTWDPLLFPQEAGRQKRGGTAHEKSPPSDAGAIDSERLADEDGEACNLDRITFIVVNEASPCERCFRVTLQQFSEILDACVIVDLRPFESYKLGHIPNSCHIERLFDYLSERNDSALHTLVTELFNDNQGKPHSMDANKLRKKKQLYKNLNVLIGPDRKAAAQKRLKDATIMLAAGDGSDEAAEMKALQRLIFEYHAPNVCYYRINGEDWPKFFTLSQI